MQVLRLDPVDLDKFVDPPKDSGNVQPLSSYVDDVCSEIYQDQTVRGACMPWSKTHDKMRFRPHEVTLWAGRRGNWKSFLISHIALGFMEQRQPVLLASLEMPARKVGARMVKQALCARQPRIEDVRSFHADVEGLLWLYTHVGRITPQHMLAVMRWSAAEKGVKHIVLDNLTKVVSASVEATKEQEQFVGDVCQCALDYGVHIHVIAHVRKGNDPTGVPSDDDIRGSGAMADQADNIVTVWRNKPKERAREKGEHHKDEECDMLLSVEKQRHGDWDGQIQLWLDQRSMQFVQFGNESAGRILIRKGALQ